MVGNVTTYGAGQIARGGFGPAGTGHPPADIGAPPVTAPTFELLAKGIENGHAAADRIEAALDRIEPAEPAPSDGVGPGLQPAGHAQNALRGMQHLFSRLHRLADRLENHA